MTKRIERHSILVLSRDDWQSWVGSQVLHPVLGVAGTHVHGLFLSASHLCFYHNFCSQSIANGLEGEYEQVG